MWTVRIPRELEGMEILIYGYLQGRYNSGFSPFYYVAPEVICKELSLKNSRGIEEVIGNLLSGNKIKGEKISGGIFKIIGSSLNPEGSFVMLPWDYLVKIASSGHKYKYQLLTFYVRLFAHKNNATGRVGKIPLSSFPDQFNVSPSTGIRYIKFLEDLGVLKVYHNKANNGYTNIYSLPEGT